MPKTKLKLLLKESLLAMIRNSLKTKMFRNSFYLVNGKKLDILEDGQLSCAIYVSSILYIFKLILNVHATIGGTVKDLEKSNWHRVAKPQPGDVLIWSAIRVRSGSEHKHIGFCIDLGKAVSNNYKFGYPIKHHITFGIKNGQPARKIIAVYRTRMT